MNRPIIGRMSTKRMIGRFNPTCVQCDVVFNSIHPNTKTCSSECRNIRNNIISGRKSKSDMPCGTVGAVSEMAIAIDLMRNGYSVFRALSPACFCDLIACKDDKTLKIECRTGYRHPFSNKIHYPKKMYAEIDLLAVFVHHDTEIHYFSSESFQEVSIK